MSIKEILERTNAYDGKLPAFPAAFKPLDGPVTQYIDHTLLKTEATPSQIDQICREAAQFHFASVCVNSLYVPRVHRALEGSGVKTCSVVGFPLGAMPTAVKVAETENAVGSGADEIDMVMAVGLLKGGEVQAVLDDVRGVADACHGSGAILKVILEMGLLTQREKILACLVCQEAGADFVKTSTGFFAGGATVPDVELMRRVVGPVMGVKAAGGVRSLDDARAFLKAGATRLGSSSGVKIAQGLEVEKNEY
ncbi:deoxyribose-phosphate aldolase [Longilinea arvoryzae]|uniref:Deoxyribose-phosphate aldolase n=1 Tax=Longilinea arvoryzae TaxID=360412 RepID=A0A0S7BJU6_9CHLR|nr:deoxyribose-phosphate aldolase [Longilinea arvoryzae]GAP13914.1 deoxyribose-phosphate aldolase [Longilinea arvoryzae]